MAELLTRRRMLVHPTYRIFVLHDPECDDSTNFNEAIVAAIAESVGWAYGMVAVTTVAEIGQVPVTVEVWDGAVEDAGAAWSAELDFPSGRYVIDVAVEDEDRIGHDLPGGPAVYRVHLAARRDDPEDYLFHLWRLADSPPSPDDDE
ncbi:hypothetical protein ACFO1B_27080 [Dactylosporangium siamense]|uniref:Uncharacterized protein n=1 Tax=Dactylosporangium siamense TaxID=685454 RepID=A0A919U9B4_9ACTN|nr:hypothetical protein [Dactylosporangium siamense]GIG46677.1 hypothetical protein Dsi01nite_047180 [Dactylosporangium siamense]